MKDLYLTACFTGHRKINLYKYNIIKLKLENEIENLIIKGVRYFGCGGERGFDLLAGLTVLKLQKKYNHIHLIMVLPCKNQYMLWSEKDKQKFKLLLKGASKKLMKVTIIQLLVCVKEIDI